jgi:hypothetical protein
VLVTAAPLRAACSAALLLVACGSPSGTGGAPAPDWTQWGQSAQHTGALAVAGQPLDTSYLDEVDDPFVATNLWQTAGASAHYMTPLTQDGAVYVETKGGTFSPQTYSTQTWGVVRFAWTGGALARQWQMTSDWTPPGGTADFWEPVFHGALANGCLYVPGAKGTLLRVDETTGAVVSRIVPNAGWDAATYAVSPVVADAAGNVYFTVLRLAAGAAATAPSSGTSVVANDDGVAPPSAFYAHDVVDSLLVRVDPRDAVATVSVSKLLSNAPGPTDACETTFADAELPWPPSPTALAPTASCGSQRVALNAAPAVALDGTVYLVTRAHFNSRYAYLVAVSPDLAPRWQASLRDRLGDGCGVPHSIGGQLEPNGAPGGCAVGASYGVDPATNRPGAGGVVDDSSASPVVAPDGTVLFGALTSYNYSQGHLMHFGATGQYLNAYPFGWDTTPAIYAHDGTFSVVTKENHYGAMGSYCSNPTFCPTDRDTAAPDYPEGYFITQLSPGLEVEWQHAATNEERCEPGGDAGLQCVADHPHSFEWCVNAPAVDALGTVYAASEDGWLYAIAQGGALRDKIFQLAAVSSAYTPVSLDAEGRVYSQSSGHVFVTGR